MAGSVSVTSGNQNRAQELKALGTEREHGIMIQGTWTPDTSYTSGGDTMDLSSYFYKAIFKVIFSTRASKYVAQYVADASNTPAGGKVKIWDINGNAEGSGNLSAQTFDFLAFGY